MPGNVLGSVFRRVVDHQHFDRCRKRHAHAKKAGQSAVKHLAVVVRTYGDRDRRVQTAVISGMVLNAESDNTMDGPARYLGIYHVRLQKGPATQRGLQRQAEEVNNRWYDIEGTAGSTFASRMPAPHK